MKRIPKDLKGRKQPEEVPMGTWEKENIPMPPKGNLTRTDIDARQKARSEKQKKKMKEYLPMGDIDKMTEQIGIADEKDWSF